MPTLIFFATPGEKGGLASTRVEENYDSVLLSLRGGEWAEFTHGGQKVGVNTRLVAYLRPVQDIPAPPLGIDGMRRRDT